MQEHEPEIQKLPEKERGARKAMHHVNKLLCAIEHHFKLHGENCNCELCWEMHALWRRTEFCVNDVLDLMKGDFHFFFNGVIQPNGDVLRDRRFEADIKKYRAEGRKDRAKAKRIAKQLAAAG